MTTRAGWRRFDSLFTRLLLVQALLVVGLTLLAGKLYFVERNRTVALLLAEHVASAIAAANADGAAITSPAVPVQRRADAPTDARDLPLAAPRVQAFVEALALHGVQVEEVRVTRGPGEPTVWLRHAKAQDGPWLGVAGRLVEPSAPRPLLIGLAAGALLVIGLSWWLARQLTRPLEHLRERIRGGAGRASSSAAPHGTPEIAEIEHAYDELLARLEAQKRERALLLAGVSHDLRSPLGRIRMAAELLPEDGPAAQRRATIVHGVRTADRLIESFLDLVRAGELPLDEPVDLAALAQHVAQGFEQPPEVLRVEAPPSLLLSRAHHHLLERALVNLLDNAFKHGCAPVLLRLRRDGDEALLEVRDSGEGVPEALRAPLLQAFARGDASRARPGTGLGLAVVQQVAERFGGRVEFDSEPGGWWVRLRLPIGT